MAQHGPTAWTFSSLDTLMAVEQAEHDAMQLGHDLVATRNGST